MGRPTTKAGMHARDLLQVNDDWPTRRHRFKPTAKRLARVADRRAAKRALSVGCTSDCETLADELAEAL